MTLHFPMHGSGQTSIVYFTFQDQYKASLTFLSGRRAKVIGIMAKVSLTGTTQLVYLTFFLVFFLSKHV